MHIKDIVVINRELDIPASYYCIYFASMFP